MANAQVGPVHSRFVNKQRTGSNVTSNTTLLTTPLNFTSVAAMRSALGTFDAAFYTSAKLDRMSTNDMVYALRVHTENGTASNGTI